MYLLGTCAMERRPSPRVAAMAARWLLVFLLSLADSAGVLRVHAQVDNLGFISIDCGMPEKEFGYVDSKTKIRFTGDAPYTDAGTNRNVSVQYAIPTMAKSWFNVRSFPAGARNCYTIRSLESGLKYLIRARFMYGNYDGLNRPPVFDLHLGVNYWKTVNITDANTPVFEEIIAVVPGDTAQVCLVNTGSGTPFISGLDVRPIKNTLYPQANETQGLVLVFRANLGANETTFIRYPDDRHDRIWYPFTLPGTWSVISTNLKVQNIDDDKFEAPSAVMQTAVTPLNSSLPIEVTWDAEPNPNDPAPGYICILHVSELQLLTGNAVRQFYVNLNGKPWYPKGFSPQYLYNNAVYNSNPDYASHQYNVTLNATANSTLPPILNAAEIFSVVPTTGIPTAAQDVSAITAIKDMYQVKKNWMGDPCVPKKFTWDGLSCTYAASSPQSITGLNLSSSGLSGNVSSSFGILKGLQYLDLSHNNLAGPIPDTLSQLSLLTLLDLTGNQLSGSIPSGLLKRAQDGFLTLRYGNNPNLCSNGDSCQPPKKKSSSMLAIYVAVPIAAVLVIALLLVLLLLMRRRNQGVTSNSVQPRNNAVNSAPPPGSLQLNNIRFTYNELKAMTDNFRREIGRGGFGKVYEGFLQDDTQVAVKLRSESSEQGVAEFMAEAQTLAKIHHKYLVSLIGYCNDQEHMALIYEFMSEGSLHEHLRGRRSNTRTLTWGQRLRIALESAQGLEYLHKGCNPPFVHRDVKTSNILLNANLEAKIADFGLLKAYNNNNDTHVSTGRVIGTLGYVAPEYQATYQLTSKSDVYSFGVVLLEIVTGQKHILNDPEPTSIIPWVRQRLSRGNIDGVVDARMRGDQYDVNSVWKVTDIALKCTAEAPAQRPTMSDVVAQLQECLELETSRRSGGDANGGFYTADSGGGDPNSRHGGYGTSDVSTDSAAFEMEYLGRVPTMTTAGPVAR